MLPLHHIPIFQSFPDQQLHALLNVTVPHALDRFDDVPIFLFVKSKGKSLDIVLTVLFEILFALLLVSNHRPKPHIFNVLSWKRGRKCFLVQKPLASARDFAQRSAASLRSLFRSASFSSEDLFRSLSSRTNPKKRRAATRTRLL